MTEEDFGPVFDWLGEKICELRIIFPNGFVKQFFVENREKFAEICQHYNGRAQVYCSVNERDGKGGLRENVTALTNTTIDVDANRSNKKIWGATEKELQHAENVTNKILTWFQEQGFKRPLVVCSGNGFQLWCALPRFELTDENRDEVEDKVQEFHKLIKKKFDNPRVQIDNIGDLPRVIGVPFTWNKKPKISDERPARLRMPEDKTMPTREVDPKLLDFILGLKVKKKEYEPTEPVEYADQKVLRVISKLCPARKDLWEKGVEVGERSHALHYMCCHFAVKGLNKSQICHLLWDMDVRTGMNKFADRPEMYEYDYDYEKSREEWPDFGKKDVTCEKMQEHGFCREEHKAVCPPILREQCVTKALELGKNPVKFLRHVHQSLEYRLTGEWKNRLFMFLAGVGANVRTTIIRIYGANAAGKKMLYYWLKDFFGEENVIVMSSQTAAWLKRKVLGGLDTRGKIFILIEERVDIKSQAKYQFEQIYSEDKIKIGFNVRGEGGDWEAIEVELQGPLTFITTSTELEISLHAKTRQWEVNPDESMEQTQRIDAWFDWRELLPLFRKEEENKEIEIVKAYLSTLKRYNAYRIPFIQKIRWKYKKLEDRRKKPDFCNLIRYATHLFQHILPKDEENGVVFALPFIYDIVQAVADEIVMVSRGACTESEKRMLDFINEHYYSLLSVTMEGKKPKKLVKQSRIGDVEPEEEDVEAFMATDLMDRPDFEDVFGELHRNTVTSKLNGLVNKKWLHKKSFGRGKPSIYFKPSKGTVFETVSSKSLVPDLKPVSRSELEFTIQHILNKPKFSLSQWDGIVNFRIKPEEIFFEPKWHGKDTVFKTVASDGINTLTDRSMRRSSPKRGE